MSNEPVTEDRTDAKLHELLTLYIDDQQFGIPILSVQDVLRELDVTPIPLSDDKIEGALNLRGRVVTAINVRKKLGLPPSETGKHMSIVVEHNHELYSLMIDRVGDVLRLNYDDFEKAPATLDPLWNDLTAGIHRLDENLLIVLDVGKILDGVTSKT